jgi:DNA-binding IclR family transcriptional regulator
MFTPNTIQSRQQSLQDLETIRADGIASDREEHTLVIFSVGAVVNAPQDTMAVITIPVPSIRFYVNEDEFVSALTQTCMVIYWRYKLS